MATLHGSCLCGDVAWEVAGPLELMSHCHCARCRKSHGSAFATYAMTTADQLRIVRGAAGIVHYTSSPGIRRPFCARCGGVVPDAVTREGLVGVPVGPLDDDPGGRPGGHIFVASKAPWFTIEDALPRCDAFPPGVDFPVLPDLPVRDPAGRPRGSCLCGAVGFILEGEPTRCHHCHCSRCRKARGAAHASNVFTAADGVRFTRGEDRLASYKLPGARYFAQVFCRDCGSPMPRVDRERGLAVVPLGALDDDPGMQPQRHIFVGSKAPWYTIADALPQDAEFPPPR
jgi:hypothetical protein